jgi:glutamate 5-kinase
VDDGAKKALREQGRSLLLPGIAKVEGDFNAGEVVSIRDLNGTEFARGIARASASEIRAKALPKREAVHRDDLVIL